jgi:tRNA threonylcarbamoyl adenosine modification protein YeaZ
MKILALELSTARGSLAWLDESDSAICSREWPNDRKNSGPFFGQLQALIQQRGAPDKIVVGLGPGSYAGTRIAISAAIGISAAQDIVLIGYPSVCAFNDNAREYVVIGDARRRSFFLARVGDRTLRGDYELLSESEIEARLRELPPTTPVFSSDLLPQFGTRVEQRFPSAEILAKLALNVDETFVRPPLEPIYLREANITMPNTKKLGINA